MAYLPDQGRMRSMRSLCISWLNIFLCLSLSHVALVPEAPFVPLVRRLLGASMHQKREAEAEGHCASDLPGFPRLWLSTAFGCVVNGSVYVDGVVQTDPTLLVSTSSTVALQRAGEMCRNVPPQRELYLKFYKPRGVISATNPKQFDGKIITADYFPPGVPPHLHNAGRLDRDSEGILLWTTDGHFSHFVTSPGHGFEKEYVALTNCARDNKPPSEECLKSLREGVVLKDGHIAKATRAEVIDFDGRFARLRIVVTEGKFRMLRRMLRGVGYCCMQLLRVRTCGIGDAVVRPALLHEAVKEAGQKGQKAKPVPATLVQDLQQLLPGDFAPIEPEEVARIYASAIPLHSGTS